MARTKKKVLMLLSDPYRPDVRLRKELDSLARLDLDITIVAWDRENAYPADETIEAGRVTRLKIRGAYSKNALFQLILLCRYWWALFWYLMKGECDLIHSHNLDTLLPGFLAARLKGIKVIYDAHEAFPEKVVMRAPKLLGRITQLIEAFLVKRVDATIAVTQPLLAKYAHWQAKRLVLVPNYADRNFYDHQVTKKQSDVFTMSWIGSIRPFSGIDLLLSAIPQVLAMNRQQKINVLLAGKIYGAKFQRTLEELIRPINDNVEVRSWVPYHELPRVYAGIDLAVNLLYPCLANEVALPVKLLEALACGVPVIATKVGPIQDIIREGDCGVLVDYDQQQVIDAIGKMIAQKEVLSKMGERGRMIVREKYNWERVSGQITAIYQDLLGLKEV